MTMDAPEGVESRDTSLLLGTGSHPPSVGPAGPVDEALKMFTDRKPRGDPLGDSLL